MAWDRNADAVTIKAIGTVESNMGYSAVNYNDPITIGIAQWYGVRAANILHRIRNENRSSMNTLAPSLASDITAHPASDTWWNSRYLSNGEGASLKPILNANQPIQNDQFATDISEYLDVARAWGMDPDGNTKAVQFFCTMYHQAPARTRDVLDVVGSSPTLEEIYQGALNNPVLGQYPTRQTTARNIIAAGDRSGVTLPGDSEPDPTPPPETDPDPIEYEPIDVEFEPDVVTRVERVGDHLMVHFERADPVMAYATAGLSWLPRKNDIGGGTVTVDPGTTTPPPDPEPDPDPDPTPTPTGQWHNPLGNQRCTNRYGTLSYTPYHSGIDMGAKTPGVPGDPVYALYDGTVVRVGGHNQVLAYNSGRGLILDMGVHNGGRMYAYYGHLNSVDVPQGTKVVAGQKIATMGGTGKNHLNTDFAVHLHLVIFKNKTINTAGATVVGRTHTLDPEPYLRSKGILQSMNACPYN